jgi:hypothetical protein
MKILNKINLKMREKKVILILKIEKLARRLKKKKEQRVKRKVKPSQNMTKILTFLIK